MPAGPGCRILLVSPHSEWVGGNHESCDVFLKRCLLGDLGHSEPCAQQDNQALKLQAVWKLGRSLECGSHVLRLNVPDLTPAEQGCLKARGKEALLKLHGLEVACKPESSARIPLRDQEASGRDQGQARW